MLIKYEQFLLFFKPRSTPVLHKISFYKLRFHKYSSSANFKYIFIFWTSRAIEGLRLNYTYNNVRRKRPDGSINTPTYNDKYTRACSNSRIQLANDLLIGNRYDTREKLFK